MVTYQLCADKSLSLRDLQVLLEVLKDREIEAAFVGFECVKVGKELPIA